MKKLIVLFSIWLCTLLSLNTYAQNLQMVHSSGTLIVSPDGKPLKLRGFNLGGWLNWEGWIFGKGFISETSILNQLTKLVGSTNTEFFRENIYSQFISEKDIQEIARDGFNAVRIPINHRLLEDDSTPFIYLNSGWDILDRVINWCEKYNIYVVLDMHSVPGGQATVFTVDPDSSKANLVWNSEINQKRTIQLWRAIAQRYKDRQIIAGYDLINEPIPNSGAELVELYRRIISSIREVDPGHMIILEGAKYARDFSIFTSRLDENQAYSFHIYTWFNENCSKILNNYRTISISQNIPLWCGEFGENTYSKIGDTVRLFENEYYKVNGWSFWTFKKVSAKYPGFLEIQIPKSWTKTIKWINSPLFNSKPTYNESIMGMNEFCKMINYDNNVLNTAMKDILITNIQWEHGDK
jgi:endoglucanase